MFVRVRFDVRVCGVRLNVSVRFWFYVLVRNCILVVVRVRGGVRGFVRVRSNRVRVRIRVRVRVRL